MKKIKKNNFMLEVVLLAVTIPEDKQYLIILIMLFIIMEKYNKTRKPQ